MDPVQQFYLLLVRAVVQTYAKEVGGDPDLVRQADVLGAFCIEHDDVQLCIAFAKAQPCRSPEAVASQSSNVAAADKVFLQGLGLSGSEQ